MRWIFLAPFVVLSSFCVGQTNEGAMVFPGNVDGVHVDDSPGFDTLSTELSVCSWYWADNDVMGHLGYGKPIVSKNYRISDPPQPDDGVNNGFQVYAWFYQGDHSLRAQIQTNQGWLATECTECIEFDIWQHQCLVLGNGFLKVYLNGIETGSQEIPEDTYYLDNEDGMEIGSRQDWSTTGTEYNWTGKIQEVGIWSRALTADEIMNLQSCSPSALSEGLFGYWPLNEDVGAQDLSGNGLDGIVLGEISWSSEEETPFCISDCIADPECNVGCMDQNACNYDLTATYDDGSCTYPGCNDSLACNFDAQAECDNGSCDYTCCPGPGCCDTGTTWDYEIEKCVPINSCPEDLNYDGIIGVEDLLTLLSSFGTPCDPPVAEWTCGDPVSYHGYDYETILIGGQCWFAENLRTELYQNGDSIPSNLSIAEWMNTNNGATAVYGVGDAEVQHGNENGVENLENYGRLYNFHAVQDDRNVCPFNWHVPTDEEWIELEVSMGMTTGEANTWGLRGSDQGAQLKSSSDEAPAWDGTNESGFSALPGGQKTNAVFNFQGIRGHYWTSTASGSNGILRIFFGTDDPIYGENSNQIMRGGYTQNDGESVRCIKD